MIPSSIKCPFCHCEGIFTDKMIFASCVVKDVIITNWNLLFGSFDTADIPIVKAWELNSWINCVESQRHTCDDFSL